MHDNRGDFIVELATHQGRVCERFESYAEARRRVDQFPSDRLIGLAFIFQQLADGSERLVCEDGKPIQFHRRLVEESKDCLGDPLPLMEGDLGLFGPDGKLRIVEPQPPKDEWDDLPLA